MKKAWIVLALMIACVAWADSKPPVPAPTEIGVAQANKNNTGNTPSRSQQDQKGTEKFPVFVKVLQAEKNSNEAADDAREREEKSSLDRSLVKFTGDLATFTLALVIATVILAVVGAVQLYYLRESIKDTGKSAAAAIAAVRPWITFSIINVEPILFGTEYVEVVLPISVRNTGNSPGFKIRILPECVVQPIGGDRMKTDEAIAKALKLSKDTKEHPMGFSLFPTEESEVQRYSVRIPNADILTLLTPEKPMMIICLAVCIDYQFAGGVGQTTSPFTIWGRDNQTNGYGHFNGLLNTRQEAVLQRDMVWNLAS